MAKRRVTKTAKDHDGDITGLCGPDYWYRSKNAAVQDIDNRVHTYYVNEAGYESDVHAPRRADGTRYLRTYADETSKNNLDNLPNCGDSA